MSLRRARATWALTAPMAPARAMRGSAAHSCSRFSRSPSIPTRRSMTLRRSHARIRAPFRSRFSGSSGSGSSRKSRRARTGAASDSPSRPRGGVCWVEPRSPSRNTSLLPLPRYLPLIVAPSQGRSVRSLAWSLRPVLRRIRRCSLKTMPAVSAERVVENGVKNSRGQNDEKSRSSLTCLM